jgi:hypothetical protein
MDSVQLFCPVQDVLVVSRNISNIMCLSASVMLPLQVMFLISAVLCSVLVLRGKLFMTCRFHTAKQRLVVFTWWGVFSRRHKSIILPSFSSNSGF